MQVIATATLAALVGGGLGTIINEGFGLQNYGQVMAGALIVTVLCLLADGALALGQRRMRA